MEVVLLLGLWWCGAGAAVVGRPHDPIRIVVNRVPNSTETARNPAQEQQPQLVRRPHSAALYVGESSEELLRTLATLFWTATNVGFW
jgi:hypothetical protein